MSQKTAVIIGAGPAGLTAAYQLLTETDIIPIIFEETSFIGGISRTAVWHGNRMDIGGHRFFSKNKEIMDFWTNLLPLQGSPSTDDKILGRNVSLTDGGPDPEKEDLVMLKRNRVSRIFYMRDFFDYPISISAQTILNMGLTNTFKAGMGYISSTIFKRTEKSLEDFYINRFGKPLYKMFFEGYTEKVWGVHPSKIAPDWGAQRVKGLSLSKAVLSMVKKHLKITSSQDVETSLIEEFYYPKKGPGQLWEALADKIVDMGGIINLGSKVTDIKVSQGKIESVDILKGENEKFTLKADYYFSSMPIKDLLQSMNNEAPENVKQVAASLPYRDFITVGLLVNKLKIKNTTKIKTIGNIVPDCWIYIQEPDVKVGRMQIFNNWSPYMVKDLENTVWVGLEYFCNEGDKLWRATDESFIEFASREMEKIGIIDRDDVLDSVRIKVKKAYPAYFGSYSDFPKIRDYLDSIDNLYCIGRNGQHRYNNMDHSMLTAIEAVKLIKTGGTDKHFIWNVNTEESYHETNQSNK